MENLDEFVCISNPSNQNHCWHQENYILTSNPPKVVELCCWCGNTRIIERHPVVETIPHGQYIVKTRT